MSLFAVVFCRLCAWWSSTGKCLGMDSDTISHMNPDPKLTEITRSLSVGSIAIRSGLLSMTELILVQLGFGHSILCLCCCASECDPNQTAEEEVLKRQEPALCL